MKKIIACIILLLLPWLKVLSQVKPVYVKANLYFDDGREGLVNNSKVNKSGDTLFLLDDNTNKTAKFLPVTTKFNNRLVTSDDVIPGYGIYRKKGGLFYKRIFHEVNILWFGAKNNASDNTVFLQNCLNVVAGEGGGKIYFPKGKYSHKGIYYLGNNLELYSDNGQLNYVGDKDKNAVFIGNKMAPSSNIYIHDIRLSGGLACLRLGMENGDKNILNNVQISNIEADGSTLAAIWGYHCNNITIKKCVVKNAGDNGIYVEFSKNAVIKSNKILNSAGSGGITFGFSDEVIKASYATIDSNTIYNDSNARAGNYISGIDIVFSSYINVCDNVIYNTTNAKNKIRIGIMSEEYAISNVAIKNNRLKNIVTYGIGIGFSATSVISNVTIENNRIEECGLSGVTLQHLSNSLVNGNKFLNIQQNGIEISESCFNIKVQENNFVNFGIQPAYATFAGVYSKASATTITNNAFVSNFEGGLLKANNKNSSYSINDKGELRLLVNGRVILNTQVSKLRYSELKKNIEMHNGWQFNLFSPSENLIASHIRRTGSRASNEVLTEPVNETGVFVGSPEPGWIIKLEKKATNSTVKNNKWVAFPKMTNINNSKFLILPDTQFDNNIYLDRKNFLLPSTTR